MGFEVITGGLLDAFKNDIPCPDKPASEWTQEEKEAYENYCYENAEPGSDESVIKAITISSEELDTVIRTLDLIQTESEKQSAETGFISVYDHLFIKDLVALLETRKRFETGMI